MTVAGRTILRKCGSLEKRCELPGRDLPSMARQT